MGALSKKDLEKKRLELMKEGVDEVVDAQNFHEYSIKKRKLKNSGNKNNEENDEIFENSLIDEHEYIKNDILNHLSLKKDDQIKLLLKLNSKNKTDVSINDINWKNVKTF